MLGDSHLSQDTDSSLLATLITGDTREAESALERLHQRYHAELWRFTHTIVNTRDIAEDIVQDAFIALWNRRLSLDPSKNVRAYLYASVRNGALMHLRSNRIEEKAAERIQSDAISDVPTELADIIVTTDIQSRVTHAVNGLSERQRTAVTLRWLRGLSYDDVATIMGISRQAVDALLQRTYSALRTALSPLRDLPTK